MNYEPCVFTGMRSVTNLQLLKCAIPIANETLLSYPCAPEGFHNSAFVGSLECLPCQGGRTFLQRLHWALRKSAGSGPTLQEVGGHVGNAALNRPISPQPPAAQGGGTEIKPLAAGRRLRAAVFITVLAESHVTGALASWAG